MNSKKVVLVSGASSGIGEVASQKFKDAGWEVYSGARRIEKMKVLEARGIHALNLDVRSDESMKDCGDKILSKEGRSDALVNNAGYGSYGSLEDVAMQEARHQFEVNIFGLARLTQLVLKSMRERGQGKIINVSSIGGKLGEPHGCWYHASKYAVEGLSDSLRMELKQFNIDVIVIQPGAIKTEWSKIARENMLKTSGNTAYGDLVKKHINMLEKFDGKASEPSLVADIILKASLSAKPKTRYVIGSSSRVMLFMRKILSDRLFDKMMLSYIN